MNQALVVLGLVGIALSTSSISAQEVDVQLRLISLHCIEPEDSGADEAFLVVNGNRFSVWSMNNGDTRDLRGMEAIPFDTNVRVELYDEDTPWIGDDHDLLGVATINDSESGAGESQRTFDLDEAHYRLTYVVEPRDG
ncbi:MAG: hypothetical protein F4X23_10845 [Gemmatimonadales bacterium]|nr:hypothetical protein [Gemmatimonadales bacterium]